MKKLISFLIWTLCFIVLLFVSDQFLLRYPGSNIPALHEFQQFYQNFRGRLFQGAPSTSTTQPPQASSVQQTQATQSELHYVYVDENGQLNFTATLDEIPARFRSTAEPLEGQ